MNRRKESRAVWILFVIGLLLAGPSPEAYAVSMGEDSTCSRPLAERLLPGPRDAGFRMDGFFVWGGSMIRVGETYHLFASRWPVESGFPEGYRTESEIVRATSKNPIGPFRFEEVVLSGRDGAWWDGKMCHNPKIVESGSTLVLFYIGSAQGSGLRKCGYATAESIFGPWTRREFPLPFGEDHNNPAPFIDENGQILVAYRDRELRMFMVRADAYDGDYEVVVDDLFPGIKVEDPDLHFADGRYQLVVEDNVGRLTGQVRHGAHFGSSDGIKWVANDPIHAYTHTLEWDDGSSTVADRRERPELFNADAKRKGVGPPTHLLTGVKVGERTWCHVQAIAPVD